VQRHEPAARHSGVLQRRHSSTTPTHSAGLTEQYPYRSRPTLPTHPCSLRHALSICWDNAALFGGEMSQPVDFCIRGQPCNICRSAWLAVAAPVRRHLGMRFWSFIRTPQPRTLSSPTHRACSHHALFRRPGPQPGLLCVWEFLAVRLPQNVLLAYGAFSRASGGCLAARPAAPSRRSTSSRSAAVPPFDHRRINRIAFDKTCRKWSGRNFSATIIVRISWS
jgi:hypothetical protein